MNDEFVSDLRKVWISQPDEAAEVLQGLRRKKRWAPHAVLAGEIMACAFALLAGIWFAWVAVHSTEQRLLFAVSAAVLLITAPAMCMATVVARRPSLAWHDESPELLLRMGIRRAESSLHAIRIARWHIWIIAAFVTMLWLLEVLGFISAAGFLAFYTTVCGVVVAMTSFWMFWRGRSARGEREACEELLAMIQVDDASDTA